MEYLKSLREHFDIVLLDRLTRRGCWSLPLRTSQRLTFSIRMV